jgi:hypothetical protein
MSVVLPLPPLLAASKVQMVRGSFPLRGAKMCYQFD